MRALIILVSMIAASLSAADDYVGTWQNKKSGFDTLSFALRKDGRGALFASTSNTILRWEESSTGIVLKIAGDGKTTKMSLTYDASTGTLVSDTDARTVFLSRFDRGNPRLGS